MIKHSASVRQMRFELAARFDKIRNLLLTDRYAPQLSHPLAYWALPADRRLPRALLHRPLGDLLRTPYDSLAAVPGIGQKKMQSLLKLLDRALHTDELEKERLEHIAPQAAVVSEVPLPAVAGAADPSNISEVTWATWRATVVTHRLGHEPLGCFAGSLSELPRVIWSVPLEHYAGLTLEAIRKLKTHGEKRVRCVVTIFGQLHSLLDGKPADGRVQVRLTPPRIETLEKRVQQMVSGAEAVNVDVLREQLLEPLVTQIGVDAGEQTAVMLRGRLGLDGAPLSVRRTAMRMRLTRARIYQLLEDAATVVDVRWPRGKALIRQLLERTAAIGLDSAEHRTLRVIAETFFPMEFRPAPTSLPFVRRYDSQQGWTHTSPVRNADRIAAISTAPAGMR